MVKLSKRDAILGTKISLFAYVALSPFFDNKKYLYFLNNLVAKMIIVVFVILAAFFDLELSIIALIAFMILNINFHKHLLVRKSSRVVQEEETFHDKYLQLHENTEDYLLDKRQFPVAMDTMSKFPNDTCPGRIEHGTDEMNDHLFDIYSDPKVKPFNEFVKLMTSEKQLESAQDNVWM